MKSRTPNWRATSPAAIVSLFLLVLASSSWGQELMSKRLKAKDAALSVTVPLNWEGFGQEQGATEVLFLQNPEAADYEALVSVSLHPSAGKFEDVVRRQTFQLLVWEGAPISTNQALKLRGATGHKWVYKARGEDGRQQLFYRLYVLLPKSIGNRRLLVMDGVAPAERSPEIVPIFNNVARSLAWGLQSETPLETPSETPISE